jgi:hypothetical protein
MTTRSLVRASLLCAATALALSACFRSRAARTTPETAGSAEATAGGCAAAGPAPEAERADVAPPGRYRGRADDGSADLELREDGSFVLTWQDSVRMQQGQWSGRYEFVRSGIGEAFRASQVQEAIDGRVVSECASRSLAVLGIDRERAGFSLSISPLGDVAFRPAQ